MKGTNAQYGFGGVMANMELCGSIQVLFRLTVLCSETHPNAKPENVRCNYSGQTNIYK